MSSRSFGSLLCLSFMITCLAPAQVFAQKGGSRSSSPSISSPKAGGGGGWSSKGSGGSSSWGSNNTYKQTVTPTSPKAAPYNPPKIESKPARDYQYDKPVAKPEAPKSFELGRTAVPQTPMKPYEAPKPAPKSDYQYDKPVVTKQETPKSFELGRTAVPQTQPKANDDYRPRTNDSGRAAQPQQQGGWGRSDGYNYAPIPTTPSGSSAKDKLKGAAVGGAVGYGVGSSGNNNEDKSKKSSVNTTPIETQVNMGKGVYVPGTITQHKEGGGNTLRYEDPKTGRPVTVVTKGDGTKEIIKRNSDNTNTSRILDEKGNKIGTKVVDPKTNATLFSDVKNPDGSRKITDFRTLRVTEKGKNGEVKNSYSLAGSEKRYTKYDANGERIHIRERTINGRTYDPYEMRARRIGNQTVYVYEPSHSAYYNNPFFWMWLMSNNNHQHYSQQYGSYGGGGWSSSSGYYGGGGTIDSGSGGAVPSRSEKDLKPGPFTYAWTNAFDQLPTTVAGTVEYKEGIDWIADYALFEMIAENSYVPGWGDTWYNFWNVVTFGWTGPGTPKSIYDVDPTAKNTLRGQLVEAIIFSSQNKLTDIITLATPSAPKVVSDGAAEESISTSLNLKPYILVAHDDDMAAREVETKNNCELSRGDVIKLVRKKEDNEKIIARMVQVTPNEDHCTRNAEIEITIAQAQDMQNDILQRLNRGITRINDEKTHFTPVTKKY